MQIHEFAFSCWHMLNGVRIKRAAAAEHVYFRARTTNRQSGGGCAQHHITFRTHRPPIAINDICGRQMRLRSVLCEARNMCKRVLHTCTHLVAARARMALRLIQATPCPAVAPLMDCVIEHPAIWLPINMHSAGLHNSVLQCTCYVRYVF